MKTSKRALLRWFKQEDWHIICYWRICSCVYDNNKKCTRGLATACGPSWPPAWRSSSPGPSWAGPRGPWGRSWTFSGKVWRGAGRLEIQILCYEERPTDVRALTGKREKGALAQEEPLGGVVEECLASQLTWLQSFGQFCVGRLWVTGQWKASQQNRGPDPEHEGCDGVPWQGHRGEDLLEVKVQNQGCCQCWQSLHCIIWFSICSSAHFFFV